MFLVFASLVIKKQATNILLFLVMICLLSVLSYISLYFYFEPAFQLLLYRTGELFFKDNYVNISIYEFLFIVIISFINFFLITLSLYIVNSEFTDKKKLICQSGIVLFFIGSSIFYCLLPQLSRHFTDIEYINGLNLVDIPKDKCYISVDSMGKEINNCLKGYYLYKRNPEQKKSIKIPLTKQNYILLNQFNNFLGVDSYPFFSMYYFDYNYPEAGQEFAKSLMNDDRNFITSLINFASLLANGSYILNTESLKILESIFENKEIIENEEIVCFKSLLKYKQAQYSQAKKLSVNSKNKYCVLTRDLLKGEIKKTVFKGFICNKDDKMLNKPVMITTNQSNIRLFPYIVDWTLTDKNGNFRLTSETNKDLKLIIFDNKAKKLIFNYKKLGFNHKGGIVDLGKIELK